MDINKLKEEYEKDITLEEETIDKQVINLPKIMAKYQFFYADTLNKITNEKENLDRLYYETFIQYKQSYGDLANFTFSSTELKKMLECHITYRESNYNLQRLQNDLKLTEEMMSNIKSIGYGVNNYLTYKRIMVGDI